MKTLPVFLHYPLAELEEGKYLSEMRVTQDKYVVLASTAEGFVEREQWSAGFFP